MCWGLCEFTSIRLPSVSLSVPDVHSVYSAVPLSAAAPGRNVACLILLVVPTTAVQKCSSYAGIVLYA